MKSFVFMLIAFTALKVKAQQAIHIIPQPAEMKILTGSFSLSNATAVKQSDEGCKNAAKFLSDYLLKFHDIQLANNETAINKIYLELKPDINAKQGSYKLESNAKAITIRSGNEQGLFYGVQTLIQLLPLTKNSLQVPCVTITDYPRFTYRGMHLDVSRHFFDVAYVKKYIDYIALHKMNYFHWHLTDDQGWRIEIKKYPKLTEVGAWRDGTIIGRYPGTGNDGIRYGGFYTQEQIKEVVAYAAKRYITVVPEIEMPGHSMAALAAYPELGTNPKYGYAVSQTWGINDVYNNVLNPSEYTFNFLQDVIDEIIPLFPSEYIHIGGDECSKRWWKESAFCQQLMKEKGIKNEHELQSYFIQRIEKYINSKGKKIIGWDEILEGGLAPNATVMSWTGEEGGIEAAKQKHDVIMTPGGYCYLDHSQTKYEDSVTIGSFLPLEKVYNYEPVPKELNAEQAKYILGAQGNVWTEYMASPAKVEYMIFPRMSALSEVVWSPKAQRNWKDFEKRMLHQFKRYEWWGANYSKAYFDIKASVQPTMDNKGVLWKLETNAKADIEYSSTLSATSKKYQDAILVSNNDKLIATLYDANKNVLRTLEQKFIFNKATGKKISLTNPASGAYPGNGAFTLVDGVQNEKGYVKSDEYLGFSGKDAEAIIDLGNETEISSVTVHALQREVSWIWKPLFAEILVSDDGKKFMSVGKSEKFTITDGENGTISIAFNTVKKRFIKVFVKNQGKIPSGNPGEGNNAWMFLDEIEVW